MTETKIWMFYTKIKFILFLMILSSSVLGQGNKYAFLLGIEEYYPNSNLSDLKSVENDLFYMKFVLEAQGFECEVLNANGLSKGTIFNQMNKALLDKVKSSDVALFYYTGHGTQIFDYDDDECEDNLDEAIVLSTFNEVEPQLDQYILDDELNLAIRPIREKLGDSGQMVLIFDACHSGSFSRGKYQKVQSLRTNVPMPDYEEQQIEFSIDNCSNSYSNKGLASIVGMYSSSYADKSFEFGEGDKKFGVFTYALIERLRHCDKDYTYSDWVRHIELFMSDKFETSQKPSTEGDLDQLIWRNGVDRSPFPQGVFFRKNKQRSILSPELTLTRGGRLVVYPKGTRDTSAVAPKVVIEHENLHINKDGSIQLNEQDAQSIEDTDVFFVENEIQPKDKLNIYFDRKNFDDIEELLKLFEDCPWATCTENRYIADLVFEVKEKRKERTLEMKTRGQKLLEKKNNFDEYPPLLIYQHFQRKLIAYNNLVKIKPLEQHSNLDIQWSIDKVSNSGLLVDNNCQSFKLGEYLDLRIKNINDSPVFVYIYFVDSENNIDQLYPSTVKLFPQESTTLESVCKLVEPLGTDQIKLVASTKAINFDLLYPGQTFNDKPLDFIFSHLSLNKPIIYNLEGILDTESLSISSKEIFVND